MSLLSKRVKARKEESEDEEDYDLEGGSSPSVLETGDADDILSSDGEGDEVDDEDEQSDEEQEPNAQDQLKNISFGTLARAQDSLAKTNKRKRGSDSTPQQEDKLEALRARLRQLKEAKKGSSKEDTKDSKRKSAKAAASDESEDDDDSDANSDEADTAPRSRSSKHAPGSQSSKYQVTRKREVVDAPKRKVRDPRFGPMAGLVDDSRIDRNYSFLQEYEGTEMNELKAAIKKSKDADEKGKLKDALMGMENKKRARDDKERQQAVIREHRKKEKEAIEQGKKPFYLKQSELKKQALVNKYEGMKGKEREKAIDRKRKKESQREKKSMPQARRTMG